MKSRAEIRQEVSDCISRSACDDSIIQVLYNDGDFFFHEDALWDFKLEIGVEHQKRGEKAYDYKICDMCKDIVAFYNSRGGYIIFGVDDTEKKVVGTSVPIPVDDIQKRLELHTSTEILFTVFRQNIGPKEIQIIFIPPRSKKHLPIDFKKDSKVNENGKHCYKKGDIYYRDGDSSSPAKGAALVELIASSQIGEISTLTDHNLPDRDKTFTQFIGRREELDALWRWFLDTFNSTRLVAGIGGVGKTTLVREFSEEVLANAPLGIEKIIWLSAKKTNFDAEFNVTFKTDERSPNLFDSEISLYRKILLELGYLNDELKSSWNEFQYLEHIGRALSITSTFLVVDDLDSLDDETQRSVFSNLTGIFHSLSARSNKKGRCLMTARMRLGASRSQYHELNGFRPEDFYSYLVDQYKTFGIRVDFNKNSKLFRKFFDYSHGSPLFATSVVRLVRSGFSLEAALNKWRDAEGDEVREFALRREVGRLTSSQQRTLYAITNLSPCSFVEIKAVTEAADSLLQRDLAALSDFHLLSKEPGVPAGGREFGVPSNSSIIRSLVRDKISDPMRIEKKCRELRKEKASNDKFVSQVIGRVVALWRDQKYDEALRIIEYEYKKGKKEEFHCDLECVYGRALLRSEVPNLNGADAAFARAHAKGCVRPELTGLWVETRQLKKDWHGVIEVCELALRERPIPHLYCMIGSAYVSLAYEQLKGPSITGAIDTLVKGGKYLNSVIGNENLGSYFEEVNSLRKECFEEAVRVAERVMISSGDYIYLWNLAWTSFECYVRSTYINNVIIRTSYDWVEGVLKYRERITAGDLNKINEIIGKVSEMISVFDEKGWSDSATHGRAQELATYLIGVRDRISP